jgi:hypothetical protein
LRIRHLNKPVQFCRERSVGLRFLQIEKAPQCGAFSLIG